MIQSGVLNLRYPEAHGLVVEVGPIGTGRGGERAGAADWKKYRYDLVSREQMSVLVTRACFLHLESCVHRLGSGLSQDWSADSSSPLGRILMHLATCW